MKGNVADDLEWSFYVPYLTVNGLLSISKMQHIQIITYEVDDNGRTLCGAIIIRHVSLLL